MPHLFLFLLLGSISPDLVLDDKFDQIELNHQYDQDGKHLYNQIICWGHDEVGDRMVEHWFLAETGTNGPRVLYIILEVRQNYCTITLIDQQKEVRVIKGLFVETFTQYDPERADSAQRNYPPRKGLVQRIKSKDEN